MTVLVLDRPRHAELIRQIREAGARIRMISDGDVGGAIETAKPGAPVDVLMGERARAASHARMPASRPALLVPPAPV